MNKFKSKKGFSLVELLVVITIMAILSVVAYMALGGQTAKARNARRVQDLSTLQSAAEIYFVNNNNTYPSALNDLVTTGLIKELPKDPVATSANYDYAVAGNEKTYQLAALLEDETGGAAHKAYVIGNGSGLLTEGCTYNSGTGACGCTGADICPIANNSLTCLPYCLP